MELAMRQYNLWKNKKHAIADVMPFSITRQAVTVFCFLAAEAE
jgi:hypothetical protein